MSVPHIYMIMGNGGVGKTTTAAALGLAYATKGFKTLVMTIDPARRLADAMGIQLKGNSVTQVHLSSTDNLYGMMLDPKATWDETVTRYCEDPNVADQLLNNKFYEAMSTRLSGSQEYMASERLFQIVDAYDFEVIIVDTAPATHALDFLRAPTRIHKTLSQSMLSSLTSPGFGFASTATIGLRKLVSRLIGQTVLAEIADFFRLFRTVSNGLKQHANEVEQWLRGDQCTFYWVTLPEEASINAMHAGIDALDALGYHPKAILLNRSMSHSGDEYPKVQRPDSFTPEQFQCINETLQRLWNIRRERSHAHMNLVQRLEHSLKLDVFTMPTVRHSEDAFYIIENVAQRMAAQRLL